MIDLIIAHPLQPVLLGAFVVAGSSFACDASSQSLGFLSETCGVDSLSSAAGAAGTVLLPLFVAVQEVFPSPVDASLAILEG